MRIFIFGIILILNASRWIVCAQDATRYLLRLHAWHNTGDTTAQGLGFTAFTRLNYGLTNWNTSAIGINYQANRSVTGLLVCRDGIPGFSWYHVLLSEEMDIGPVTGNLQLRFSGISCKGQEFTGRLGGYASVFVPFGQNAIGIELFDFTSWIIPRAALVRGSPALRLTIAGNPGRMLDLLAAFEISGYKSGPLTAGIRLHPGTNLSVEGLFRVLPAGAAIGINWSFGKNQVRFLTDYSGNLGITPTVIYSR